MTQHSTKFRKSIDIYKNLAAWWRGHSGHVSRRAAMRTSEADVLVVGAGAAGLAGSGLLARSCVRPIPGTKYPSTAKPPPAPDTKPRPLEGLSGLGHPGPATD